MTDKIVRPDNLILDSEALDEAGFYDENVENRDALPRIPTYSFASEVADEYRKGASSRSLKQPVIAPQSDHQKTSLKQSVVFKSASDFCKEYIPAAYAVEPMVRSASMYTLTARTGSGKTALLITTALAVVSGNTKILNCDINKGRIAYLVFENPDDFRVRLATAAFLFNVNLDEYADDFIILDTRHKPEDIIELLEKMAAERPFTLIIIDTLAAFFDGKDSNDAVQAGNFMRRLRPLTQIAGLPAVLVAAHPVKNAGKDNLVPYGSGAILNEVDGNLTLWRDDTSGLPKLHWQGKLRGMEFEPMVFRFEDCSHPDIRDAKGRGIKVPVMMPASDTSTEDRENEEERLDLMAMQTLYEKPGARAEDVASVIGRGKTAATNRLNKLTSEKLMEKVHRKWHLTSKGKIAIGVK